LTWKRGQSNSQLDNIWVNSEIILELEVPQLLEVQGITDIETELDKFSQLKVISDIEQLNKIWNKLLYLTKAKANKHIPFSYKALYQPQNFTLWATRPHNSLKHINKAIYKFIS
ncbi:46103_t:CDS:2, partial [Gigaspora margarita]